MDITIWLIIFIFLLDFVVLWNIIRSKRTRRQKNSIRFDYHIIPDYWSVCLLFCI